MLCLGEGSELDSRGEEAIRLHSMPVPYNGEPIEEEELDEDTDYGWGDTPEPDVQRLPNPKCATPAIDIKVVVLDLLGTLFVSPVLSHRHLTSY